MPVAEVAARLALTLIKQDLCYVALDEQRAAAVTALVAAFAPDAVVIHLPSSDALPGDAAPPSPANAGRRVAALRRLRCVSDKADRPRMLLVTTAEATAMSYPAPAAFDRAPPRYAIGEVIDPEGFAKAAQDLGYVVDDRVDEPGEVAVRGCTIDIFPADLDQPVRIEIAEGAVSEIRRYDPMSQRSAETLDAVELGRATEPTLGKGVVLLDHAPEAAIVLDPGIDAQRDRFLALVTDTTRRGRAAVPIVTAKAWAKAVAARTQWALSAGDAAPPRFIEGTNPTRRFTAFAKRALEEERLLLAGSPRDLRFLQRRLAKAIKTDFLAVTRLADAFSAPPGRAMTLVAPVERGFAVEGCQIVAAGDLLGGRAGDDMSGATADPLTTTAGELRIGDVIVHEDFGIGVVEGVEPTDHGGDAIRLLYARDARRLAPVTEADRIWRYGADADAVTLDSLDGASWVKRRGAIDAAIAESAKALAALAAERDARSTDPIVPDAAAYERFAAGFAFTETPDQARAIAAVREDLASGKPMDRLVVGDVGYGKTEVALRAAALVALAGRQVAIAAPTTVLVRQHLETFARRFDGTGIAIAGLSRLSSTAEKGRVKAGLADGSIGVVIGTSAIAGKGVTYANLALVVVDEEQRFGTADKAKLRDRGLGHVLTLSATPIPRTLQSALVGLQRISTIATPPARRQPIRTSVAAFDDATVRTALMREHGRGGQSFVVVPRIEDIAPLAETLARLVPELSVVAAHGKMPPADLDTAMVGFASGEGNVLLATNIIEAGLDVPRANTMIVHHADRFGLSQLHQLRGRVGRGGRRAQILLLTDADAAIAPATLKRLRTLQAFDRLGGGFAISARDLDLRGAGDLVGEAQAGHMKLIGIDLYQYLLGLALRQARGETVDEWMPELNLGSVGRLPEAWVPEEDVRLTLYARLARLRGAADLDAFEEELEDRFGPLPEDARHLVARQRIAALARAAGIAKVDAGPAAIALTPRRAGGAPAGLEAKGDRWLLSERIEDDDARMARVEEVLAGVVEDM